MKWYDLRPVGMDFLESAPRRFVAEQSVALPPARVWEAFVDPSGWRRWWPGLEEASYGDDRPPFGVGTYRETRVGGHRYEERILAWDEPQRWAYRIDRATLAIAHAQVEVTEISAEEAGARVRWTIAADPRWRLRVLAPLFPRIMRSLLARAMRNLEALAREPAPGR